MELKDCEGYVYQIKRIENNCMTNLPIDFLLIFYLMNDNNVIKYFFSY